MYAVYFKSVPGLTKYTRLVSAGDNGLRLPAPPFTPLTRSVTPILRTAETASHGAFIFPSGPSLREVAFQSALPEPYQVSGAVVMPAWAHQPNGSHQYHEPSWWASLMMQMAREGIIFQLQITEQDAPGFLGVEAVHTNHLAVIRSYSDWEDEGDTRYFNINFQEFRPITVRKVKKKVKKAKGRPKPARPGSKPKPGAVRVHRTTLPPAPHSASRKA